jgi:death-on-curing protein
MKIFFLTINDIFRIHEDVIADSGGGTGLRDKAGIESAIAVQQATYFGQEQYPTIAEKASILCFEVISQHPFIEATKGLDMPPWSISSI